jgi:hypothetical protein
MAKLLTERVQAAFANTKVAGTPEAPVVEGVLLCGPVSANRRRYLKAAFEGERVERYNGVPVKVTARHGDSGALYQEQIGTVQNARHRESDGMPIGDIAVNPHKPLAPAFLWDAKHQPKACGMSHVANCDTVRASDGWDEVTELVEAVSVDVIGANGAATTKGLFESKTMKLSVKALCESLIKHPKVAATLAVRLKRLGEMDGMDALDSGLDAAPADTEPDTDDAVMSAFKAAISDVVDKAMSGDLDPKAALAKIKSLLSSHAGLNDDGTPDTDADPTTPESKPTLAGLVAECKAKGFAASADDLAILSDVPTAAGRAGLIERLKKAVEGQGAERPKSTGRTPPTNGTTRTAEAYTPRDPKDFAKTFRE